MYIWVCVREKHVERNNQVAKSIEQSHSSANLLIPLILWNSTVLYCVQKSSPTAPVLNQINGVHVSITVS